jgi:alcohol dehydrogenase
VKGLVLAGPERIEFRADLPDPAIEAPGDALVSVRRAGICGSDLHPYHGREPIAFGIVPGHEAAGDVLEVGPAVSSFQPGDRVFLPFTTSCGRCGPCGSGLSARCEAGQLFGWAAPGVDTPAGLGGTQAETVRVPLADTTLLALSDDQTYEDGVLLGDNFTTGYYCARQGGDLSGGLVVVVGCGTVGLSALVSARHLGARSVIAVDPVPVRREAAMRLGAERAVPPDEPPEGARVVLEAVGSEAARRLAWEVAAPGATISSVGVATGGYGFSPAEQYDKNLTVRGGRCPVRSLVPEILEALRRETLELPTASLVEQPPIALEDGPAAYRKFAARTGPARKPILAP